MLRGGFTRVEQTLLDGDRGAAVIQQRMEFQDVMRHRFTGAVEQATGRRVIGFMSGNQQDPDLSSSEGSSSKRGKGGGSAETDPDRRETDHERLDRQLDQLLQELRVAMPGVQVLFAFLLAVPFQQRFGAATGFQRHAYFVTLLAAAVASVVLIAPTAYHRLLFEQGEKRRIVRRASLCAVAGLVALAIAITSAVVLVTDVVFGAGAAVATGVAVGLLVAWLWFAMGLVARVRGTSPRG